MDNAELAELERRINELRKLYDGYFAGLEKREPLRQREALVATLRRMDTGATTTQLQFRFNNLRARLATLEAHWNRVVKQIEEGTFHRKKGAQTAGPIAQPSAVSARPSAPGAAQSPLQEAAMRALYQQYSEARAKVGEPSMSYEAMVSSLKKQVPMVIERYKCKSVDFKVGIKDGKTIIRAVPVP